MSNELQVTVLPRKQKGSRPPRGVYEKHPGSGVWWIRFVDSEGKYRREKIGSYSAALKLYMKRKQQALEGKKLPETLKRRLVLFSELCDDTKAYIERNYAVPQHDLGRLERIRDWFTVAADAISAQDIQAALDREKAAGKWSASCFNHYHTLVSLAFRLGVQNGKLEHNPMRRRVRREKEDNSRVRYLRADEEKKLLEVMRANPAWAEHEPELIFAISTGLRRRSMYQDLVWENIDFETRVATVSRTKNGDPVHIPLNSDAMRALAIFLSRGDGTGRVVRNAAGEPLNYPTHWFVPAVRAAGISNYRWHDNRHTFASRLRQRGVPLGNIAELLGHKGLAMTRRYAHLAISNLHEAVARIENSTSTTVAPEPKTEGASVAWIQ